MNNQINTTAEKFNFSFSIHDRALEPFTHLKLFNGYNEIIKEGYGNMNIIIPKGLYKLRIEINEHVEDRDYRIAGDFSDFIEKIETTSSMPSNGFVSTHEYFSKPTLEWSQKSTTTELPINLKDSSFFLLLRYSDETKAFDKLQDPFKGYFILNDKREIAYALDIWNTKADFGENTESGYYGWIAFHEKLPAGQYYFVYRDKKLKREMPFYIFEGWQTQLFMMIKAFPLFASARISIEKQRFTLNNTQNLQLDALIQKMYNGIYFLPNDIKQHASHGKWENPMLGILACYMYLLTNESEDDSLFITILENLQNKILRNTTAPDLVALRLLGAVHFKNEIPQEPLLAPCMVAVGLNAFLKQSYEIEKLIPRGGLIEKLLGKRHADSIWTTYDPLIIRSGNKKSKLVKSKDLLESLPQDVRQKPEPVISKFNPSKDWVTSTILNQLSGDEFVSISDIASQLQVTSNTIKVSLNKIQKEGLDSMTAAIWGDKKEEEIKGALKNISENLEGFNF